MEFLRTALGPDLCFAGIGSVNSLGHRTEVLLDVEAIDHLDSFGKEFLSDFPNPGCALTDHRGAIGLWEATARRGVPARAEPVPHAEQW